MTAVLADRTERGLPRLPLVALAFGSFCYVTAEQLPIGVLPQIAGGLHVGEARVGLLLTVYAAVAGLTAIPFTALTIGMPRRRLITLCLTAFTASQVLAAIAPTFAVLAASRLIAALAHGVFWASLAPAAARLAPPGQGARATSMVFVGNTGALVAGVPLGTALGQAVGWRLSFAVLGVLGAASAVAVWRALPELRVGVRPPRVAARIGTALAVARHPGVAAVSGITGVVVIGHFAAYTYIAPLVRHAGGLSGFGLSALLLGYGAAGVLGNLLAGRAADTHPGPGVVACLGLTAAALATLASVPGAAGTVVAALAWGLAAASIPVSMQSAILRVAPDAADAASAVYVVAYQIGIGGGAFVGEQFVATGHLGALPVAAGATILLALLVVARVGRAVFPRRAAR